jgi:hypothetical protein
MKGIESANQAVERIAAGGRFSQLSTPYAAAIAQDKLNKQD